MTVYGRKLPPTCSLPDALHLPTGAKYICDGKDGCGRKWSRGNNGENWIGWYLTFGSQWRERFGKGYPTHNPRTKP